jgi:RHS repeat-associated protein
MSTTSARALPGRRRLAAALTGAVIAGTLIVGPTATPALATEPPPTAVSLSANKTHVSTHDTATLTATANASVSGTGYSLQIFNQTTGARVCSSTSVSNLACSVLWNNVSTTYIAYVAMSTSTNPPSNVQATSNTVNVSPVPFTVTLTTDKEALYAWESASLTAVGNQGVLGSGLALQIFNKTTGARVCVTGTTSTASSITCSVAWTNAPREFVAYYATSTSTNPPSNIQATSNIVSVSPVPFSVTLTTSKEALKTGESATLSAVGNQSVSGTGLSLQIFNKTTNAKLCGTGSTSSASSLTCSVGWANASHDFVAYYATSSSANPPSNIRAISNVVNISPVPFSVALTTDKEALYAWESATLTAVGNQSVSGSGLSLQIFNKTSGARVCVTGTTSTASSITCSVAWTSSARDFVAYYATSTSTNPPSNIQATSNIVSVSPVPFSVTLTTNKSVLSTGESATLTAAGNQSVSGTGLSLQIFNKTTGTKLCGTGTTSTASSITCTAVWAGAPHEYVAYYAGTTTASYPPANIHASSNIVKVSPAPFSVSLTPSLNWINDGDTVTLTAVSSQSVSGSGYAIQVFDLTTGTLLCSVTSGTSVSCSFTAHWPSHTFTAVVAPIAPPTLPLVDILAVSGVIIGPTSFDTPTTLGTPEQAPGIGDPVNAATGNFYSTFTDLSFGASQTGLGFGRVYNSLDDRVGMLGRGWSGSYQTSISLDVLGNAILRTDDGRRLTFLLQVDGSYTRPIGYPGKLTKLSNGTWRLAGDQGGTATLNTAGRLVLLENTDGTSITFAYTGSALTSATSSTGASIAFAVDATNRAISVTTSDGRTLNFTYVAGLLATAEAADGGMSHYAYDAQGRLTSIVDGDGRTVVVNVYDDLGRVTQQDTAHGQMLHFDYSDDATRSTTLTEQSTGAVSSYTFDAGARLLTMQDPTGATLSRNYSGSGHLAGSTDRLAGTVGYLTDMAGNVTSRTLPGGTETRTFDSSNRLVSLTDVAGNITSYAYAGTNRVPSTITWPDLTVSTQTLVDGLVTTRTDADGVSTTLAYDTNRNLSSVTDGAGNTTTMTYDQAGRMLTRTTPTGAVTSWTYDEADRVLSVTDPLGAVTASTYDHAGNVTSTTDPAGRVTNYTYNNASELVETEHPDGTITTNTWDDHGNMLSESRPGGAVTTYTYGPLGRLSSTTDPTGEVTSYGYNANGQVTSTTDALSGVSTTTYDSSGQVLSTTDAAGNTTSHTRDGFGRILTTTDPSGNVSTRTYDIRGRLASETDPLSRTTSHTYTDAGRLSRITYPDSTQSNFGYDNAGRRTTHTAPGGGTVTTHYNPDGRITSNVSAAGLTSSFTYDAAGRTLTTTEPSRGTTSNTYTVLGHLASRTDAAGAVTTFTYDLMGHLTSATDPLGHVTGYEYDDRGNRTTVTDANNHAWTTAFDLVDRPTTVTDPLGHASQYTYDPLGRLSTLTDAAGLSRSHEYDLAGNLKKVAFGNGSHIDYSYDPNGRMLTATDTTGTQSRSYDDAGQLLSDSYAGKTVGYAYDDLGRVDSITYPGGAVTSHNYDLRGRLTAATHSGGGTAQYTYDLDGRVLTESLPGGVTRNYSYTAGLLAQYGETRNGTATTNTLTRDGVGRLTELAVGGQTTTYDYDQGGQLTGVTGPTTAGNASYSYNNVGDLTSATQDGATTTYTLDHANRLVGSVTGSASTDYSYDDAGRLIGSSSPNEVTVTAYDPQGRLHSTADTATDTTTTLTRAYTPMGMLAGVTTLKSTDSSNPGESPTVTNNATGLVWDTTRTIPRPLSVTTAGGTTELTNGQGLAFATTSTTPAATFSRDALGNLMPTTDTANLVAPGSGYSAYGKATGNPDVAFGYRQRLHVGRQIDLPARSYAPAIGRLISRDPIEGTPGLPVSTNPYHYANNDPINQADPSGLNPGIKDEDNNALTGGTQPVGGFAPPLAVGAAAAAAAAAAACQTALVDPKGPHTRSSVSNEAWACMGVVDVTLPVTVGVCVGAAATGGVGPCASLPGFSDKPKADPNPTEMPRPGVPPPSSGPRPDSDNHSLFRRGNPTPAAVTPRPGYDTDNWPNNGVSTWDSLARACAGQVKGAKVQVLATKRLAAIPGLAMVPDPGQAGKVFLSGQTRDLHLQWAATRPGLITGDGLPHPLTVAVYATRTGEKKC